jgi:hypothetical protein
MLLDFFQSLAWKINHNDRFASGQQSIDSCSTNSRGSARDNGNSRTFGLIHVRTVTL